MDPLAELEKEDVVPIPKKLGKGDIPNFPVGAKVRVARNPELDGFDLNVVQVYWTGNDEKGYWMLQAKMGEDSKACVWAPADHFILEVKETIEDVNIHKGCEQATEGTGPGDDNKIGVEDSIKEVNSEGYQEIKQDTQASEVRML